MTCKLIKSLQQVPQISILSIWKVVIKSTRARIRKFSSGGSNLPKILKSKKKKKKKKEGRRREKERKQEKTEGCGCSFPSAEVWFKSTFKKIIYIQVYFR